MYAFVLVGKVCFCTRLLFYVCVPVLVPLPVSFHTCSATYVCINVVCREVLILSYKGTAMGIGIDISSGSINVA